MDSDIPSIFFPIGSPKKGGTCEFATKKCIEYCPSGQQINDHERYSLRFFEMNSAQQIFEKLLVDYEALIKIPYNAHMLQWFVWGDCPSTLTSKSAEVIMLVNSQGIPQYGFTRNKKLWETVPAKNDLNIGLSVDGLKKAKRLSLKSGKMIAHPDISSGYAEMIFAGKVVTRYNGWWCSVVETKEVRNSDCSKCLKEMTGCYSRGSEEKEATYGTL